MKPISIRYMGSKETLAPLVASIVRDLGDGPCLDLFAGMCSIAAALAEYDYPVWSNDIQAYAYLAARCATTESGQPPSQSDAETLLSPLYLENYKLLSERFQDALEAEGLALTSKSDSLATLQADWRHAANDPCIAREIRLQRSEPAVPYRLATLTFAHGYFGILQSIQLDSLRYAMDRALHLRLITPAGHLWFLLSLLQAAGHLSASPGHFAEYLKIRCGESQKRLVRLRRRSVWEQFLIELTRLKPLGTPAWRCNNRVSSCDAHLLLSELAITNSPPRIIYADPPYSRAQYSRYYHVLETLTHYDYPDATGIGRYRRERFQTPFSHSSRVAASFHDLISLAARLGSHLVLSYPTNGLLFATGVDLRPLLAKSYSNIDVIGLDSSHSTLGAKVARARTDVKELIYVARNPH